MLEIMAIPAILALGVSTAFLISTDKAHAPGAPHRGLTDTNGQIIGPDTVTTVVPEGSFVGQCAVVTPPVGDPCEVVGQMLQYSLLMEVGATAYHKKWMQDNPGEVARLNAHLANPQCILGNQGPVQDMKTHWGAALYLVTQAIACLPKDPRNPRPALEIPIPPALDPKRKDKTPPTAPGPITVTP